MSKAPRYSHRRDRKIVQDGWCLVAGSREDCGWWTHARTVDSRCELVFGVLLPNAWAASISLDRLGLVRLIAGQETIFQRAVSLGFVESIADDKGLWEH